MDAAKTRTHAGPMLFLTGCLLFLSAFLLNIYAGARSASEQKRASTLSRESSETIETETPEMA